LKYPDWIAKAGQGRLWAEIIFDSQSNSLFVKFSNIQTYTNMLNMDEEKNLLTVSFTTFNLTSGTVTFKFSYKFGDEEVFWTAKDPAGLNK
jgi:hypothetical protein